MLHYFVMDNKHGPAWLRTFMVDDETGTAFVPAAASGRGEADVLLRCCFDATPIVQEKRHLFVPLEFLAREFPGRAELWSLMATNVEKAKREIAEGKHREEGSHEA